MLKGPFSLAAQRSPAPHISLEGRSPVQPINRGGHHSPAPFINLAEYRSPVLHISPALHINPVQPISPERRISPESAGIGLPEYLSPAPLISLEGQRSPVPLTSLASAGSTSLEGCLSPARHLNPAIVNYSRSFRQVRPGGT
jgi:hypothetical protein